MSKKIYSIYDQKAGYFAPPFVAASDAEAERQVALVLMSSPTLPPAVYPADFRLYLLGDYDEVSGVINSNVMRLCSCEWIVTSLVKKPAASDAAEPEPEPEVPENA